MKKAYLKELSRLLLGTVTDDGGVLEHFATDGSIFQVAPTAVAYPANTADVRALAKFVHARTAAGHPVSLSPRGLGAGTSGGALGDGVAVVFPAHMNRLLRLEQNAVTVQPGMNLHALQQTLLTHGRWLPPLPAGAHHATVGGAVSVGAAGVKSVKYGPLRRYLKALKVVLADGSHITTRRLSARELSRKRGLATLEGDIYRSLANLLADHAPLIAKQTPAVPYTSAGYALGQIRGPGNTFDLSQIFIGAEGTLGLITEITLTTLPFHPRATLVVGGCDSADQVGQVLAKLHTLRPSALEFVGRTWLERLREHRPGYLEGRLTHDLPKFFFFVEFDDASQLAQKFKSGRAARLLGRGGAPSRTVSNPLDQLAWWKICHSVAETTLPTGATKSALPVAADAYVPLEQWPQLFDKTVKLLAKYDLAVPLWGHAGDGHLAVTPTLDLGRKKDTDKLFNFNREFTDLVVSLGGTPAGAGGDGLLTGPLLSAVLGDELAGVMAAVKHSFDPLGLLNPTIKTGATESFARAHLRPAYTRDRFADYPFDL